MTIYNINNFEFGNDSKVCDISERIRRGIQDLSNHSLVFLNQGQELPVEQSKGIVELLGKPNDIVKESKPYPFSTPLNFKLVELTSVDIVVKYDNPLDPNPIKDGLFSFPGVKCEAAIDDLIFKSDNSELTSRVTGEYEVVSCVVQASGVRRKYTNDLAKNSIADALSSLKDQYGLIRKGAVSITVSVISSFSGTV
ncbi:hypothetical protein GGH92_007109 [Coemansia sp. RSA 2673]|nr:hypothetical protein GGH92_007109 [Coemansia sp. RSA 2673]